MYRPKPGIIAGLRLLFRHIGDQTSAIWFAIDVNSEFNPIVGRAQQILFGPEVFFCGLYGSMTKKQLNLLKFSSSRAAEFGASAPEVMWSKFRNSNHLRVLLEHLPNDLLAQMIAV